MKQTITLPVKTISINSMYYGNRLHGKTMEAREWTEDVVAQLRRFGPQLKALREHFITTEHMYSVKLEILIPENVLFTKKGELTSKVHDLSNVEKGFLDILFLPKYFEHCQNLNLDDRYLGELCSAKIPTKDTWGLVVHIEIKNKPVTID
jgi:hypothetical protein